MQCVFLFSSLCFPGAPTARENSQLVWLQCRPATGRSNILQRAKTFQWSDMFRRKKSSSPPYPLPSPGFILYVSESRGKLLPLTSGYLLHSSREPQRTMEKIYRSPSLILVCAPLLTLLPGAKIRHTKWDSKKKKKRENGKKRYQRGNKTKHTSYSP